MKKTCDGCKAYEENNTSCMLGYPIVIERERGCFDRLYGVPQKECHKPKTFKKYVELSLKGDE